MAQICVHSRSKMTNQRPGFKHNRFVSARVPRDIPQQVSHLCKRAFQLRTVSASPCISFVPGQHSFTLMQTRKEVISRDVVKARCKAGKLVHQGIIAEQCHKRTRRAASRVCAARIMRTSGSRYARFSRPTRYAVPSSRKTKRDSGNNVCPP